MSPNRFEATRTSKSCGPPDQIHARGIDEQRLGPDVGIVARDVREHAIPEPHAEPLRVGLGDRRQQAFPLATTRELEREPDDALGAVPREDSRLHGHFVRVPRSAASPPTCAYSPSVFSRTTTKSMSPRIASRERAAHARVEHGRPHARVLIEAAANRQQQAVERDVVLQPRIADGAEEDRVERPQQIQRVGRHHPAVLEVVLRSPRKRLPLEADVHARACRVDRAHRGGRHFVPDAVAGNHRHAIRFHRVTIDARIFHQRKPTGSQIARCTSEIDESDAPPSRLAHIAGAKDDRRRPGAVVRRRGVEAREDAEGDARPAAAARRGRRPRQRTPETSRSRARRGSRTRSARRRRSQSARPAPTTTASRCTSLADACANAAGNPAFSNCPASMIRPPNQTSESQAPFSSSEVLPVEHAREQQQAQPEVRDRRRRDAVPFSRQPEQQHEREHGQHRRAPAASVGPMAARRSAASARAVPVSRRSGGHRRKTTYGTTSDGQRAGNGRGQRPRDPRDG